MEAGENGLEPNRSLSYENEDFFILIKNLPDVVDDMDKSALNNDALKV